MPTQESHLGTEFPLSELIDRFKAEWNRRRDSVDGNVMRITSFNLLVISRGEAPPELEEIMRGLLKSHPARVIWAQILSGRAWEDSTARLHLGCRCEHSVKALQVCSEQVQICCGDHPERLSSLILSLIHGGLATHLLWWDMDDLEGTLFTRLADRCQMVLVQSSDWAKTAPELHRLWTDEALCEHAFYPLVWFQLTKARQTIARAYGQGDIELTLPKETNQRRADSDLLTFWLESLLPRSEFQENVRVVASAEHSQPTVSWQQQRETLKLQSTLEAVRSALDRPSRDPVFAKIIEKLGETDF